MIELAGLTKRYTKLVAVNDLNIFVPKGEIFGFIGPNGAGKTTTINMMGGITAPTSGSVMICGIRMEEHPEKAKSKIGFIPDRPYLYEKLTASNELIESYSHGMKQRLVMAAALLHEPEVIIVDEPMVGLDPVAIKMVKELFRQLAAEGVTIFMSTHTLKVAEDICDRIGVIHKGSLVANGTPADLRRLTDAGDADLEQVFIRLTEE